MNKNTISSNKNTRTTGTSRKFLWSISLTMILMISISCLTVSAALGTLFNRGDLDLNGNLEVDGFSCVECISEESIMPSSLTAAHLAENSVGSSEIKPGAVESEVYAEEELSIRKIKLTHSWIKENNGRLELSSGSFNHGIGFNINEVRVMLLNKDGNLGIDTSYPEQKLHINGKAQSDQSTFIVNSDIRLKNVYGEYGAGLEEILHLQPVMFTYKNSNPLGLNNQDLHMGVIAQDIQLVMPEAVDKQSNGYLTVSTDPVIWAMVNAIQEQQEIIDQQNTLLTEQQKRLDKLEKNFKRS